MDSTDLQRLLDRIGVVRVGGTNYARCPLCQPDEDDPERYRLMVSPGRRYLLVSHCPKCQVAKPQSDADRQHNRRVARQIWGALGAVDEAFAPTTEGEIGRLWAGVRVGGVPVAADEPDRASDQMLHMAYASLLESLPLSDRHRKWLAKRGLDPDWCFDAGYRSADGAVDAKLDVRGVPGLADGRWLTRRSLLVPCRDRDGLIGAVKMRLTDGGRSRMRLLGGGGAKAKQMIHWPDGSKVESGLPLWITEGERKADALYYHFKQPTVGLPGVGFAGRVVDVGVEAGAVVLALDADAAGRKCEAVLGRTFRERGVGVSVARWDGDYKGVDDALTRTPVRLEGWREEGRGQGECNSLTPNQKSPDVPVRRLRDHEILPFIRAHGPLNRKAFTCYDPVLEELIRRGRVRMTKTREGQILEAAHAGTTDEP